MKYLFANWKMYLSVAESIALSEAARDCEIPPGTEAAIFPNTLAFTDVTRVLNGSTWKLGAQDVAPLGAGAYTGAAGALHFKEAGASYALVGHSERRHVFGENDEIIRKKFEICLATGLTPVLCIGETALDKEAGKRQYRLKKQLFTALHDIDLAGRSFLVAYEPVWAISQHGKGEACAPTDADDVHGWIALELKQYCPLPVPILYGGSVDERTVSTYISRETIDGVLVGSAATNPISLEAILKAWK